MRKIFVSCIIAFLAVLGTEPAKAYNLEIVPGGTVLGVSPGDTLLFSIVFNSDPAGNVLSNYGFNMLYDSAELTWDMGNSSYTPPSPLVAQQFGPPVEGPTGTIMGISALLPFQMPPLDPPTVTGPWTLATLAFTVDPAVNVVPDGQADLMFDVSVGTNFNVDGSVVQMTDITKIGMPDVAVAPEPISSTLFITGGAILGLRRFRKKINSPKQVK